MLMNAHLDQISATVMLIVSTLLAVLHADAMMVLQDMGFTAMVSIIGLQYMKQRVFFLR